MREDFCYRCGNCCRVVVHLPNLNRGDGVCKYFDEEKVSCKIWKNRPNSCRTSKWIPIFAKKGISKEVFINAHHNACLELKDIKDITFKKLCEVTEKHLNKVLNIEFKPEVKEKLMEEEEKKAEMIQVPLKLIRELFGYVLQQQQNCRSIVEKRGLSTFVSELAKYIPKMEALAETPTPDCDKPAPT